MTTAILGAIALFGGYKGGMLLKRHWNTPTAKTLAVRQHDSIDNGNSTETQRRTLIHKMDNMSKLLTILYASLGATLSLEQANCMAVNMNPVLYTSRYQQINLVAEKVAIGYNGAIGNVMLGHDSGSTSSLNPKDFGLAPDATLGEALGGEEKGSALMDSAQSAFMHCGNIPTNQLEARYAEIR